MQSNFNSLLNNARTLQPVTLSTHRRQSSDAVQRKETEQDVGDDVINSNKKIDFRPAISKRFLESIKLKNHRK